MKHIVTGIVAHVDAGKTTLSEGLLFQSGGLRKMGRVDTGDAFLDPEKLEKQRGITIFSHQAELSWHDLSLTLLDTPGHVDFAAQTEQVLSVLDYAILVIEAAAGVQAYTLTLWRLLKRYHVPVFIFVNKMDQSLQQQTEIMGQLQEKLAEGCLDFTQVTQGDPAKEELEAFYESAAMQNDTVLADFLENERVTDAQLQAMIQDRELFPCFFGSALKMQGIETLLQGLARWTLAAQAPDNEDFGARVFKISHNEKGERLSWLRLTSGRLQPKDVLADGQKVNQLRQYNGLKAAPLDQALAGEVCVIPGLTGTYPGQGLGACADALSPVLAPVLNYRVEIGDLDVQVVLQALQQLEDEDPQLHVVWSEFLQEIRVQLMGQIQLEILQALLEQRFGLSLTFSQGSILYKETIKGPVEGVGHFEPLRHYAEVHLKLEPAPVGSGLSFASECPLEVLSNNWQNQVLGNLQAKEHLGVLIGAPLTDVKITLVGGKASNVHTVGGDFRQATWRAVRQGLMELKVQKQCEVLEPWYQFTLTVGQKQVGRALTDIERMHGEFQLPEEKQAATEQVVLTGTAPVAQMQNYQAKVRAYTHGQGQLECVFAGYRACHDQAAVVAQKNYSAVADLDNTPDSVFCAHGAGYPVAWDQVPKMAHYPYQNKE
ncbi:elongation factor G [Ligilactobacillus salitolerans]|uniref:Elongation factor G n=1 Tax=Ligilactobacillus salitolerans TaxID=1808352 RepID=A0A401ITP6_9LACO|nr:TetM/TetW/TetO/TetS family tetracycline resistance ribosomal protection protein [Ligilactobacillus salitolerans]GBG94894.1 elongation factor G [Ligilactobacillus salitolerans]